MNKKERPVIVMDGDPGADDALGILMMLREKDTPAGLISCFGNATVQAVTKNLTKLLLLADREDVPLVQGAEGPLRRHYVCDGTYAGIDGLCDTNLPAKEELIGKEDAVTFLARICKEAKGPVIYLVTGALTNLAKALKEEPSLKEQIAEVVTSSGCFRFHERASRAEWNVVLDPDAAKIVYESGIPVRAVGLDVTCMLQPLYTERFLSELPEGNVRDFLAACDAFNQKKGNHRGSLLCDPMTVAAYLDPEVAVYRRGSVEIFPEKRGKAMMTFTEDENGNVLAAEQYDFERLLHLLRGLFAKQQA